MTQHLPRLSSPERSYPSPPTYSIVLQPALPEKLHQGGSNGLQGQNLHGSADFCRGFGHAVDYTAGLILGNSIPPGTTQNGQPFRAIPSHASEQHPGSLGWPVRRAIFYEAFEEHVDRWPVRIITRLGDTAKHMLRRDYHVVAPACPADGTPL